MNDNSGMQDLVQAVQSLALAFAAQDDTPWPQLIPLISTNVGAFGTVSCDSYYNVDGKKVTYNGVITITAVGTATGGIFLPLPVTAKRVNSGTLAGREFQVTGKAVTGVMDNVARCYISFYDGTTGWASGHKVSFSLVYEAA